MAGYYYNDWILFERKFREIFLQMASKLAFPTVPAFLFNQLRANMVSYIAIKLPDVKENTIANSVRETPSSRLASSVQNSSVSQSIPHGTQVQATQYSGQTTQYPRTHQVQ